MNFEQLSYIKEIIDTKSITIAAKNLYVTQSAISQSISLLEKELGVQLFKRSRQGTIPSEEGKKILQKLLEILKKIDELQEEVQSMTSTFKGELKIATIQSIFMTFLPRTLAKFKKDYPQIQFTIMEMENDDVIEAVNKNKVDLGLISFFDTVEGKFSEQILYRPFHSQGTFKVIVPKDSLLALNKELQLIDIQDYPFIIYGENFYSDLFEKFERKNAPINVLFKSTNPEVVKKSVAEGLGISVISSLMLSDDPYLKSECIVAIPLIGYPFNFNLSFGVIYMKNRMQDRLMNKMLEYFDI